VITSFIYFTINFFTQQKSTDFIKGNKADALYGILRLFYWQFISKEIVFLF